VIGRTHSPLRSTQGRESSYFTASWLHAGREGDGMSQDVVQGDEGGKAGDSDPDEREKKEDIVFGAKCLHRIIFRG
jgi:hypothetical protein